MTNVISWACDGCRTAQKVRLREFPDLAQMRRAVVDSHRAVSSKCLWTRPLIQSATPIAGAELHFKMSDAVPLNIASLEQAAAKAEEKDPRRYTFFQSGKKP